MRIVLVAVMLVAGTASADRIGDIPWRFEDRSTLDWVGRARLEDYDVTLTRAAGSREVEVAIARKAGAVIYRWKATANTPLLVEGGTLYYIAHSEIASGARAVAIDLATGTQRWSTALRGLGPVPHSQYRNQVWFALEAGALTVQGVESNGKYIELVDQKTGKSIANRVVKP